MASATALIEFPRAATIDLQADLRNCSSTTPRSALARSALP
jgi:hypothetical protein